MDDNIFDKVTQNKKVNKIEILKTIPQTAQLYPDELKQRDYTEWRWRIYNFNNRELIEISYMEKGKRKFLTNNGNWIEYNKSLDIFSKYMIKEYYYYSN